MLTVDATKELLKSIGDGTIELDENNCCEIGLADSDFVINLRFVPEDGRILLGTVIGELPETSPVVLMHLMGELMKANFMWDLTVGNTLSMVDDTRIVAQNCYTAAMEDSFADFILRFSETAEFLTAWYEDMKNDVAETFRQEQELFENDIEVDLSDDDSDTNEETNNNMVAGAGALQA